MSKVEEARLAAKASIARQGGNQGTTVLEGPKPKQTTKEPYKAFGAPTGDQQMRLIIYARRFFMMPQYSVLYDVFFEGRGEFVSLIFPHHRISFYGRNLLPVAVALRTNSLEWVKEFDALIHEPVTDDEETVIDTIDIHTTVEVPIPDGLLNG